MECFGGSGFAAVAYNARKKRSGIPRRPHSDSQTLLNAFTFLPQTTQSPGGSNSNEGNQNSRDTIVSSDGLGGENKLKLKLKFGGVTRTLQASSAVDYAVAGVPSVVKSSLCFDAPQPRQKQVLQDNDSNYTYSSDKGKGNAVRRKDSSRTGSSFGKGNSSRGKTYEDTIHVNETYETVRKSRRVPKRRVLDAGLDGDYDDDEDGELRFLERLGAPKAAAGYEDYEVGGIVSEQGIYEDKDYMEQEEEEPTSDDEPGSKRKKLGKGPHDSFVEGRNESIPTTRNRALQSGKDVLSGSATSFIEFPDGLPPAPSKKQNKLSEVEQQLKKAEAAQRRKMQSEKAARDAEAEAIRRILGQDSGRKKKEDKIKKQRKELAQDKAAKGETLASNTVRWVFGPNGTIVIFSEDIGLPKIFNPVPCSYPPPREKCAGPNCTNAYKYRDSKSNLPLCSLDCYRAIHGKMHPLIAC